MLEIAVLRRRYLQGRDGGQREMRKEEGNKGSRGNMRNDKNRLERMRNEAKNRGKKIYRDDDND